MNTTYMSRRTKILVILGLIAGGCMAYLGSITMPDECKVPTDQMSRECLDLLYP